MEDQISEIVSPIIDQLWSVWREKYKSVPPGEWSLRVEKVFEEKNGLNRIKEIQNRAEVKGGVDWGWGLIIDPSKEIVTSILKNQDEHAQENEEIKNGSQPVDDIKETTENIANADASVHNPTITHSGNKPSDPRIKPKKQMETPTPVTCPPPLKPDKSLPKEKSKPNKKSLFSQLTATRISGMTLFNSFITQSNRHLHIECQENDGKQ